MKLQKATQIVHARVEGIQVPILLEIFGSSRLKLYMAKCGFYLNSKAMVCAGLSNSKKTAVNKCLSEFCERVSLIGCKGKYKFSSQKIVPFLASPEIKKDEKCILINSLKDHSEWLIPESLFNPKIKSGIKKIDGTGFAAHLSKGKAIAHALFEIYERHCIGLLWDDPKTKLVILSGDFRLNSSIKCFLVENKLELVSYEIIPAKKLSLKACISLIVDRNNSCYFGSAARSTYTEAIESATFESIQMYLNFQTVWNKKKPKRNEKQKLVPQQLNYTKYSQFITSKKVGKKTTSIETSSLSSSQIVKLFCNKFKHIYLKELDKIGNRAVLKCIVPEAYLRDPYGFLSCKKGIRIKRNRLPFPFK